MSNKQQYPIGVFDSGYGGLTILKEFVKVLPTHDFIYLGDNARAPYGNRSFETVYEFTLACVKELFNQGCKLIILACNTASAKALRTIQQNDLPKLDGTRRVLGVIRPTAEIAGNLSNSGKVGVFATQGTVDSNSYKLEIQKFFPTIQVFQQACPMWVPLIENNEHLSAGADYFIQLYIKKLFAQSNAIDTIILGCTHYPLMIKKITENLPLHMKLISQGEIVAASLVDYLNRHPEINEQCSKQSNILFYTTDTKELFDKNASFFYGEKIESKFLNTDIIF